MPDAFLVGYTEEQAKVGKKLQWQTKNSKGRYKKAMADKTHGTPASCFTMEGGFQRIVKAA